MVGSAGREGEFGGRCWVLLLVELPVDVSNKVEPLALAVVFEVVVVALEEAVRRGAGRGWLRLFRKVL